MATFSQIKEARLRLADPSGIINILAVSTPELLPELPAQQTAYYVESTGYYMITDKTSGADPADYRQALLRVSDSHIGTLIDAYGVDVAVCRGFSMIMMRLGDEMRLARADSGAESAQYTSLKDMLDFYRQMREDCKETNKEDSLNSTGRFYKTKQPTLYGGNV